MSLLFFSHPKETDLALFAGGELGPLARWRIERHLQQCAGCQEAVADFFHLQSEVGELAQTPAVDWNAFAQDIAARARVETPAEDVAAGPARGWFSQPRAWQLGLATAALLCTIVVVRQLPFIQEQDREAPASVVHSEAFSDSAAADEKVAANRMERDSRPAESAAPMDSIEDLAEGQAAQKEQAGSAVSDSDRDNAAREMNESLMVANALTDSEAEPLSRDDSSRLRQGSRRAVAPDVEAERAPQAVSPASPGASVGDQQRRSVAEAVPPSPAAPAPLRRPEVSVDETEQDAVQVISESTAVQEGAGETAYREQVAGGARAKAARAEASGARLDRRAISGLSTVGQASAKAEDAFPLERGFTMLPAALEDPSVDVGVAADGWVSIRAVDARTGVITITDVYVP